MTKEVLNIEVTRIPLSQRLKSAWETVTHRYRYFYTGEPNEAGLCIGGGGTVARRKDVERQVGGK